MMPVFIHEAFYVHRFSRRHSLYYIISITGWMKQKNWGTKGVIILKNIQFYKAYGSNKVQLMHYLSPHIEHDR